MLLLKTIFDSRLATVGYKTGGKTNSLRTDHCTPAVGSFLDFSQEDENFPRSFAGEFRGVRDSLVSRLCLPHGTAKNLGRVYTEVRFIQNR